MRCHCFTISIGQQFAVNRISRRQQFTPQCADVFRELFRTFSSELLLVIRKSRQKKTR